MELRSQTAIGLILFFSSAAFAGEYRFEVRHERLLKDGRGALTFDDNGVLYRQVSETHKGPKVYEVRWTYGDIQQLSIAPDRVIVRTYLDRSRLLLGVDKEFEFIVLANQDMKPVYEMLKGRLDQRFVVAMAEGPGNLLWEIPVKRLGTLQGSEGTLQVGAGQVVYRTRKRDDSRTWRYEDIDNISTSGPFQLTLNSLERTFNFQLKERLDEKKFQTLWRELNRAKGLTFLTSIQEKP